MLRPRTRGNPVANAAIMRKGGVHQRSKSAERQQHKQQLQQHVDQLNLKRIRRGRLDDL